MMIDETIQRINQILAQFMIEEQGNKLSQFAMKALMQEINMELLKLKGTDGTLDKA